MTAAVADRSVAPPLPGTPPSRTKVDAAPKNDSGQEPEFRQFLSRISDERREKAGESTQDRNTAETVESQSFSAAARAILLLNDEELDVADVSLAEGGSAKDTASLAVDRSAAGSLAQTLSAIGAAMGLLQNSPRNTEFVPDSAAADSPQRMPSVMPLDTASGKLKSADLLRSLQPSGNAPEIIDSQTALLSTSGDGGTSDTTMIVLRKEAHHAPAVSTDPATPQVAGAAGIGDPGTEDGSAQGDQKPGTETRPALADKAKSALADMADPAVDTAKQPTTAIHELGTSSNSAPAAPSGQIADAILKEIGGKGSASAAPDTTPSTLTSKASTLGAVKVLHIQLQPADLGTVSVRIALKGDALDVQLEVSHGNTATLVAKHRDALENMLKSAGLTPDHIGIQVADVDKSSTFSQQSNQNSGQSHSQNSSHSQGGAPLPNGRSGEQGGEARREGSAGNVEQSNRAESASPGGGNAKASIGSGVYL